MRIIKSTVLWTTLNRFTLWMFLVLLILDYATILKLAGYLQSLLILSIASLKYSICCPHAQIYFSLGCLVSSLQQTRERGATPPIPTL